MTGAEKTCDLLLRGGRVIDGTGGPSIDADVAISGDRIAAVGDLAAWSATETMDVSGRVVAPGFIDVHTHDDRLVLDTPGMAPKISQGVTSVVVGNCGVSLSPLAPTEDPPAPMTLIGTKEDYRFASFADYAGALDAAPAAVNVAPLIGHSTLRVATMDALDRPATTVEIDAMAVLLDQSLADGGIGLSTGLAYPTAIAAPTDEVVALADRLKGRGAIYTTHMRDEAEHVVASIDETVEIGLRAGVAVVISHHKCAGKANWGKSLETLPRIKAAQEKLSLAFDVYPYTASSTALLRHFVERAERVTVTWSTPHPAMAGRDFRSIVDEWGVDVNTAVERLSPAGALYHQMDEADLQRIMATPGAMIGSDGLPHDAFPHPRLWGTFPRVLGHYSRDLGLFPLEDAVNRMTGRSAAVFGLTDRGVVRARAFADLVVFDAATIIDRATFETPTEAAAGIDLVMVNGGVTWRDGAWNGARPGRRLIREAPA